MYPIGGSLRPRGDGRHNVASASGGDRPLLPLPRRGPPGPARALADDRAGRRRYRYAHDPRCHREVSLPITVTPAGSGVRIEGGLPLDMTTYGVEPPGVMLGLTRVRPQIRIDFSDNLTP